MNLLIILADSFFFVYYYYKSGMKWHKVSRSGISIPEKGLSMFIGEYKHTTDAKGRVSIPSLFREQLGEVFYVTAGLDKAIFVFTQEEWDYFQSVFKKIPLSNKKGRAFVRKFNGSASECTLDKSGRMLIPQNLREHASIDKSTIIIGAGSRIEIWDEDVWKSYCEEELSFEELADSMEELGI